MEGQPHLDHTHTRTCTQARQPAREPGYVCTSSSLPSSSTTDIIFFITSACLHREVGEAGWGRVGWGGVGRPPSHWWAWSHLQGWTDSRSGGGRWGWGSRVMVLCRWSVLMSSYICSGVSGLPFCSREEGHTVLEAQPVVCGCPPHQIQ